MMCGIVEGFVEIGRDEVGDGRIWVLDIVFFYIIRLEMFFVLFSIIFSIYIIMFFIR